MSKELVPVRVTTCPECDADADVDVDVDADDDTNTILAGFCLTFRMQNMETITMTMTCLTLIRFVPNKGRNEMKGSADDDDDDDDAVVIVCFVCKKM